MAPKTDADNDSKLEGEVQTAEDLPNVPLREGVSRDEVTIEPDGTHTGPAVKRIDAERDVVVVYCPCGHFKTKISVRLKNSYYNGEITCEGTIAGFPH